MDSLAQELIDEIIDRIPRQDMPASSLVARRWRCRSQQRMFEFVLFMFQELDLWEFNIPQDSDGIPSYVRHVRFKYTYFSAFEPGTLARVLKTFTSMISLEIDDTSLPPPDELAVPASLGEFGRSITRLTLVYVVDPVTVVASFVFSFPNLKELVIDNIDFYPNEPISIIPDTLQRGPLERFVLQDCREEDFILLAQWKLASRWLSLNPSVMGMGLLLEISSEMVTTLELIGVQLLRAFRNLNFNLLTHLPRSQRFLMGSRGGTPYCLFTTASFPYESQSSSRFSTPIRPHRGSPVFDSLSSRVVLRHFLIRSPPCHCPKIFLLQ